MPIRFLKEYLIRIYKNSGQGVAQTIQREPYIIIDSRDNIAILRIKFQVKKASNLGDLANTMNLEIFNLDKTTRGLMSDAFDVIELFAGYRSVAVLGGDPTLPLIFAGSITAVTHDVRAPDTITKIQCLDASVDYNITRSYSFEGNFNIKGAIETIATENGIAIGDVDIPDDATKANYAETQTVYNHIKQLASYANRTAYVENLKLYVTTGDQVLGTSSQEEAIVISEETGMIGFPKRFGITRLNPVYASFSLVSWRVMTQLRFAALQSTIAIFCPALGIDNQQSKIVTIQHDGDTHGDAWTTTLDTVQNAN